MNAKFLEDVAHFLQQDRQRALFCVLGVLSLLYKKCGETNENNNNNTMNHDNGDILEMLLVLRRFQSFCNKNYKNICL